MKRETCRSSSKRRPKLKVQLKEKPTLRPKKNKPSKKLKPNKTNKPLRQKNRANRNSKPQSRRKHRRHLSCKIPKTQAPPSHPMIIFDQTTFSKGCWGWAWPCCWSSWPCWTDLIYCINIICEYQWWTVLIFSSECAYSTLHPIALISGRFFAAASSPAPLAASGCSSASFWCPPC